MGERRPDRQQLDLFGRSAAPARAAAVGAAGVDPAHQAWARRLPATLRLGTSSWSFPGWAGVVYDRPASAAALARDGLAAYARHPLLGAVGIDRTYYAPLPAGAFAEYAAVVPEDFRFLVKAHELCTAVRVPDQRRYGNEALRPNGRFLDAGYAADEIVAPAVAGLGERLGVVLFQFPPQDTTAVGGPDGFAGRLERFLAALPRGPRYAVEIRNRELLRPAYVAALAAGGAVHCVTVHPTMPPVHVQARVVAAAPALVVRWMLGGRQGYEEARARYAPFDRLIDPDPRARAAIVALCRAAGTRGRPAMVIVNNKAEGSAPRSVIALAEALAER